MSANLRQTCIFIRSDRSFKREINLLLEPFELAVIFWLRLLQCFECRLKVGARGADGFGAFFFVDVPGAVRGQRLSDPVLHLPNRPRPGLVALAQERKCEHIAIGLHHRTRQCADAVQGAGLGPHATLGGAVAHAVVDGALGASHRQRGEPLRRDLVVGGDVANQLCQLAGREAVDVVEARTVVEGVAPGREADLGF